jgi:hypothetical protein
VYLQVLDFCNRLWTTGWRHYSMRTIIAVIRFDRDLQTTGADVQADGDAISVKLNNNHAPYYARVIAYHHPRFRDFFSFRRVAGEARGVPILFSVNPLQPDIYLDGTVVDPPGAQLRLV